MCEAELKEYDETLDLFRQTVAWRMDATLLRERHEVLFAAHSCAIEGNSFTVGDTHELREKGLGLIPHGKTLLEAMEILDHFKAYEYLLEASPAPLTEALVKETHRLLTASTLPYRVPGAVPGEYTTTDMCAGETVFGDHEKLVAQVPRLLEQTEKAMTEGRVHPLLLAARFHGFFEYLHPFRDGNGRLGRLLSNYILHRTGHPMIYIDSACRPAYLAALNAIRTEGTDEHLVAFFATQATAHMRSDMASHTDGSRHKAFEY